MSTLIVSKDKSEDAWVKNQSDDEEGSLKGNLDSLSNLMTSYATTENLTSIFQVERKLTTSPSPQPQMQSSESEQESDDIEERRSDESHIKVCMAVPFQYDQSGTEEMTSRTFHSRRLHIVTEESTERIVENNHHGDSHPEEETGVTVRTSLVFQPPSYEQNYNEIIEPEMATRFLVDETEVQRLSTSPSVSARGTSEATRMNTPPRVDLRLRRLSLPDTTTTTNYHHVHEHHHHVWNHYAPGAGGPPGWSQQSYYQPYYPWPHQQWRNTQCPTCGGGSRSPMWLLAQFPWVEKGGKLSALGGLLFLLAMGLCRGMRHLRLAHGPAPPAIQ